MSTHGAGSPQAQRIQIARQMQIEFKKQLARDLAGINERKREELSSEIADYFGKVFDTKVKYLLQKEFSMRQEAHIRFCVYDFGDDQSIVTKTIGNDNN